MAHTQVPAPPVSGAHSTPIIGTEKPIQKLAVQTTLVNLVCNPAYSHMWGEATQTSAGQAHVAKDGTLLEPPGIAAALLEVVVPINDVPTPIFTLVSKEDEKIVADFIASKIGINDEGMQVGHLVYIQCPSLASDHTTLEGLRVDFDASGMAIVGELIYQKMRPAFGGDGLILDKDKPSHNLFFKGYVGNNSQGGEDDSGSDLDGHLDGTVQVTLQVTPTVSIATPGTTPASDLQLGVEVEDEDLTQSPAQVSAAAKALADFNAAPPTSLAPVTQETLTEPPAVENTLTQSVSNESTPTDSTPTESTPAAAPSSPPAAAPTVGTAQSATFHQRLTEAIGADRVKLLEDKGLADEEKLRSATRDMFPPGSGIGNATFNKIQELVNPTPPTA